MYNNNSQMKFKYKILKWSLSDYSDEFILAKGAVKVTGKDADAATREADERNKQAIFKKLCTIH